MSIYASPFISYIIYGPYIHHLLFYTSFNVNIYITFYLIHHLLAIYTSLSLYTSFMGHIYITFYFIQYLKSIYTSTFILHIIYWQYIHHLLLYTSFLVYLLSLVVSILLFISSCVSRP